MLRKSAVSSTPAPRPTKVQDPRILQFSAQIDL
jgi:hypothetical protein